MKLLFPFLALGLLGFVSGAAAQTETRNEARSELPLRDGWTFHRGAAEGAEAAGFDDRAWQPVAVPHTWNVADGSNGGGYYQGDGWYRRRFRVPADWTGRRIFLEFDAASRQAEVFVNGRRLGLHRGGFARFRFDVTAALAAEGENLLAVRVNNRTDDNMIPVSGDFTIFGGLYRPVRLLAVDPIHLDLLDYGSPGVLVRQVAVSPALAELQFVARVANDADHAEDLAVRTTFLDAAGATVAAYELPVRVDAAQRAEVSRRVLLPKPHLWQSRQDPYLYQVRTEVLAGGTVRDAVTVPLGLRSYDVDLARGFFLNGVSLDLHGVNRHQERAGKGWAVSAADEDEDFAMLEELGCTMVRQSHYQQSQHWNDLADRRGMIQWAELAYVNDARDNPEFLENAKQQLRELIRQNQQHPSILFWGIGNETFVRDPKVTPPDTNERIMRELARVAREEDPSRLTTYASNGHVAEPRAGIADLIGFNHYFGWYHDEPADFASWLDGQHQQRPDLRIGMSEFGAGANITHHEEPAHRPEASGQWHPEEWQAVYHEVYWSALTTRPWVWCKLIWVMFDVSSDGRNEGGTPGWNDKGLVTGDRTTRKDAFYWYQANWSTAPVLHLTSKRFNPRRDPTTTVKVYSNAATVELKVNGASLGSRNSTDRRFVWSEVKLQPGSNAIEVQATIGGQTLTDRCTWNYEPKPDVTR